MGIPDAMTKSLDAKIARIRANPSAKDFILADAKDADMAFGITATGPVREGDAVNYCERPVTGKSPNSSASAMTAGRPNRALRHDNSKKMVSFRNMITTDTPID